VLWLQFVNIFTLLFALSIKVPQIVKLLRNKSSQGISLTALSFEVVSYTATTVYYYRQRYAFTLYGEVPIILVQTLIVYLLILHYRRSLSFCDAFVILAYLCLFSCALFTDMIPLFVIECVYGAQFISLLGSRVPQIYINYQNKSTGQLAFATCWLQCVSTTLRAATSWSQLDDHLALGMILCSAVLKWTVVAQFWWYGQMTTGQKVKQA